MADGKRKGAAIGEREKGKMTQETRWQRTPTTVAFDPNLSFDDWKEFGQQTRVIADSCRWHLGSWAAFGEARFGEAYDPSIAGGSSPEHIRQCRWVHENVPAEIRQQELTWSHHRAVAGVPEIENKVQLLGMALAMKWTVATLEAAAKETKRTGIATASPPPAEASDATRLFPSGRIKPRGEPTRQLDEEAPPAAAAPAPGEIWKPRVVGGTAVTSKTAEELLWDVVNAARAAVERDRMTDELRTAVAALDDYEGEQEIAREA